MAGAVTVALGSFDLGAKFMSAYPITPSSAKSMEYMVKYAPAEGGVMLQTAETRSRPARWRSAQLVQRPRFYCRQQAGYHDGGSNQRHGGNIETRWS